MNWRYFFYLTNGERRALLVLLSLIALGGILLIFGDLFYHRPPDAGGAVGTEQAAPSTDGGAKDRAAYAAPPTESRPRELVGRDYRRPSVHRDESVGERVRRLTDRRPKYPHREKLAPGQTIELNAADTTALQKVPGIGPYYARRIVKFRELLGGFARVEQLGEVYGIDEEKYAGLAPWFTVDARRIRRLAINRMAEDSLRRHPYISYAQARAVVRLRRKNGSVNGWGELSLLEELSDDDRSRLEPYVSFE